MATRGFLIRFIDIGLIVLFGFLMISDIEAATRVELAGSPESTEEPEGAPDETVFVVVSVEPDGSFRIGRPEAGERRRVPSVEALTEALRLLAEADGSAGLQTVILIEPHPASVVQRTVDVMDVADRLGIPKSLQMEIEIATTSDTTRTSSDRDTTEGDSDVEPGPGGSGSGDGRGR